MRLYTQSLSVRKGRLLAGFVSAQLEGAVIATSFLTTPAFVAGRVGFPLWPKMVVISFRIKDPDLSTPSHFLFYC